MGSAASLETDAQPEDGTRAAEFGVSAELLRQLLLQQNTQGWSTAEVCRDLIVSSTGKWSKTTGPLLRCSLPLFRPARAGGRCSFSALVRSRYPSHVQRATHFISHAHSCDFGRLVASLCALDAAQQADEGLHCFFWIDVFALNQHDLASGYSK